MQLDVRKPSQSRPTQIPDLPAATLANPPESVDTEWECTLLDHAYIQVDSHVAEMFTIWTDASKSQEVDSLLVFNGEFSRTIYIEALGNFSTSNQNGVSAELKFRLDDQEPLATDSVNITPVYVDVTAYRPQGPGPENFSYEPTNDTYAPFPYRTAVHENVENLPTMGPGIRINGDDDNGNDIRDRQEVNGLPTSIENDYILVELDARQFAAPPEGNLKFRLRRTSFALRVFVENPNVPPDQSMTEIPFDTPFDGLSGGAQVYNDANSVPTKIWVEWRYETHGEANLVLDAFIDHPSTPEWRRVEDYAVFHTFKTVVLAIGGNGNNPYTVSESNGTTVSSGVYKMALELYNRGFDVDMLAENKTEVGIHRDWHEAVEEAKVGVNQRGVENIALIGHSQGGGAVYEAALLLFPQAYPVKYTAYIDAINWDGIGAVDSKPPGTSYHVNFYQTNGFVHGGSVNFSNIQINVNTDVSWTDPNPVEAPPRIVHTEIDDVPELQAAIILGDDEEDIKGIEEKLPR